MVPMDASVLTNNIFVNPTEPIENRALTFFLTAMIVEPLSVGRAVGHLELVPRLYLQSLSTSALAKVTTAMSISAFCVVGTDASIVRQRAYHAYGEAVTELWRALKDEKERGKNETLLACVLMVVVESLLSQGSAPNEQWRNHINGASELLRQRGWDKMLKDPVARRLFSVVRGFLTHDPDNDMTLDEMFSREIPVPAGVTIPPETRLGRLKMSIAHLRDRGFGILVRPNVSDNTINSLVAECREMEQVLLAWEESLPEGYRYTLVDQNNLRQRSPFSPPTNGDATSLAADLLPAQLHRYPDPHLQRLWNSYRIARIIINAMLHRAATLPHLHALPDAAELAASTAATLETLASDIVASIPPHILDPAALSRDSSKAAEIALAYYCLWPLYIARGVATLPAEKRWHIRGLMEKIVYRYEVRHGVALLEAGDAKGPDGEKLDPEKSRAAGGGERPLWCKPWDDSWMEDVWEWTFMYGCGAI